MIRDGRSGKKMHGIVEVGMKRDSSELESNFCSIVACTKRQGGFQFTYNLSKGVRSVNVNAEENGVLQGKIKLSQQKKRKQKNTKNPPDERYNMRGPVNQG